MVVCHGNQLEGELRRELTGHGLHRFWYGLYFPNNGFLLNNVLLMLLLSLQFSFILLQGERSVSPVGQSYCSSLYCAFLRIEVLWHPTSSRCIGTVFPTGSDDG